MCAFTGRAVFTFIFLELGFEDPSGPGPGTNKEENGNGKTGKKYVLAGKKAEAG